MIGELTLLPGEAEVEGAANIRRLVFGPGQRLALQVHELLVFCCARPFDVPIARFCVLVTVFELFDRCRAHPVQENRDTRQLVVWRTSSPGSRLNRARASLRGTRVLMYCWWVRTSERLLRAYGRFYP